MDLRRIKEARKRERLSQAELAQVVGVAPSQISRFENGFRRPHLDEAIKIAEKLKLELSDIIPPEDNLGIAIVRKGRGVRTSLPLPEGQATIEYPATLSPNSRQALRAWLELMAKLAEP